MINSFHLALVLKPARVHVKLLEDGDMLSRVLNMIKQALSWWKITSGEDLSLHLVVVMIHKDTLTSDHSHQVSHLFHITMLKKLNNISKVTQIVLELWLNQFKEKQELSFQIMDILRKLRKYVRNIMFFLFAMKFKLVLEELVDLWDLNGILEMLDQISWL